MNPIKNIISKIATGSTSELVKVAVDAVDKFTLSKEEKSQIEQAITAEANRHAEKVMDVAMRELEVTLEDVASARAREISIANAENVSWITRNASTLLAFSFVGVTLTLYVLSVTKAVEIHADILRDLRDIVILIMGYYFGSSVGSHAKTKQLDKVMNK